jgi:hypothetical protein
MITSFKYSYRVAHPDGSKEVRTSENSYKIEGGILYAERDGRWYEVIKGQIILVSFEKMDNQSEIILKGSWIHTNNLEELNWVAKAVVNADDESALNLLGTLRKKFS